MLMMSFCVPSFLLKNRCEQQEQIHTVEEFMTKGPLMTVAPDTPLDTGESSFPLFSVSRTEAALSLIASIMLRRLWVVCAALEILVAHDITGLPVVTADGTVVSLRPLLVFWGILKPQQSN